jgi:hypothetical protein
LTNGARRLTKRGAGAATAPRAAGVDRNAHRVGIPGSFTARRIRLLVVRIADISRVRDDN